MTTCDDCEFAKWNRTKTGRRSPTGIGECERLIKHPLDVRLPAAFRWIDSGPRPLGGFIKRGDKHLENCAFKSVSRQGATP